MSAPWRLSAFLLVALPLAQATDDRSVPTVTINGPSVIAFWMTPTSNDTLAADPDLASALDEHQLLTHTGVLDVAAPNVDKSTKVLIQIGGAGPIVEPE